MINRRICNHEKLVCHHITNVYIVWKDDNDVSPVKHVLHDFKVRCQLCGMESPISGILEDRQPDVDIYQEEFDDLVRLYKPMNEVKK